MVSRRGLLFGNRGEKPQGDITNSETTRHGFRSREPLAHETRGMLTRRVFGVLTIATATALGLGVGTNPREVEATEIRINGVPVETVELSTNFRQLVEQTGRPLVMQINGGTVRLHRQEGLVFLVGTHPDDQFPRMSLDIPQGDRTEQQMLGYGFEPSNVAGNWRYYINMSDINRFLGQTPPDFMLVVEQTVDVYTNERVMNFFAVPAQNTRGPPIANMIGNQPTYFAYCMSYYPDRASDQTPIWTGRLLLYNRGDADPASAMAQR